jgi:hypothetical protein
MKFIRKTGLLLTIILLILMALHSYILAQSATITVNPGGTINVTQGGTGSVSVAINGTGFPSGDGISAFDVTISWDKSVINVDAVSSSWIFPPPLFDLSSPIGIGGHSTTPLAGVSVASLSFTAVGNPGDSTAISVSVNVLSDNNSDPIPYTTSDTIVQIIQEGAVTHTLTMQVSGNGSSSPAVGDHSFVEGTVVNISATPDAGWRFVNWTGDVADPSSVSTTVTVDSDKTVTANFIQLPTHILTMAVNGNGSSSPAVGDHSYVEGTVVNVSATPDAGWRFVSWTGDVADPNSATTAIILNYDKTVTANFSQVGVTTPWAIPLGIGILLVVLAFAIFLLSRAKSRK